MKLNLLIFALLLLKLQDSFSQQTLSVRISTPEDDLEEYIPGANQTKILGSMDIGSSDLELGMETKDNIDPMLIGLRFTNIAIPKGSLISKAYLQFTVDNTNKNTDPCNLFIYAESTSNSISFDGSQPFNLSKRNFFNDSVEWNIPVGSWTTIGQKSLDQQSTDVSILIQRIVDQESWNGGNALSLFIKGSGLREAESFDGSPADAPLLIIEFIPTLNFTQRIQTPEDDLEEYLPAPNQTKVPGAMDAGSSDLELGMETINNVDPQYVGMRFTNILIPKDALIKSAYIQFTVDNTSKNTEPTNLHIYAEQSENANAFNASDPFNLTKRPVFSDSVSWNIPTGSWTVIGQKSVDQKSTDISSLVQKLVNQTNWNSGNALALFIKGTGLKEAESYDGSPADAPQLIIEYIPIAKSIFSITTPEDDLEEYLPGANQTKVVGSMDAGSSDLELGMETKDNIDPLYIGMRFINVNIPKESIIHKAYLQFTVDNTNKNTDPCNLTIWAEKSENPLSYNSNDPFNLTKRPVFNDSIIWNIPVGSWTAIGQKSTDQQSADITLLLNNILAQANWNPGNPISLFIKGSGLREAESYDGSPADAVKLVIEYLQSEKPELPITAYPLNRKADWYYWDRAEAPPKDWNTLSFQDKNWNSGSAPLGYGDPFIATKINFGVDNNNKILTAYFRKKISIADSNSLTNQIEFNVRADDGIVLYINGVEAFRSNMPGTAVDSSTKAIKRILGNEELYYYVLDIPKSYFVQGNNIIAAEIHQWEGFSSDLSFDLQIQNQKFQSNPTDLGCIGNNDQHIACFTSLLPRNQNQSIEIPSTHTFQSIVSANDPYVGSNGKVSTNFDFTGFVPINGSSTNGHLSINHETEPGGVSIFDLQFNPTTKLWQITASDAVDFSPVVMTAANCSGTVTPWNTIITCEETDFPLDANNDGYRDLGWNVEIDPKTRLVKDYGNGQEKLWALGCMSHENVVIKNDRKTLYQGEDAPDGNVYKFVADQETNLSKGKLYVLKLDGTIQNGEATDSKGVWLEVPNSTKQERNDVKLWAKQNGATAFAGVEDVEINPINGMIYFAVKGFGRVYRFLDEGTTVKGFETFVGGNSYRITSNENVVSEEWGQGNDNLTFDDRGNLWVLQDGGSNFVWVIRPDHTQTNPKVEIFMQTPIGSEPTGMTFSPDYKYMFISIQEPSSANSVTLKDASGKDIRFNKSTALVIARKDNLGIPVSSSKVNLEKSNISIYPNPFDLHTTIQIDLIENSNVEIIISNTQGKTVYHSGRLDLPTGKNKHKITLMNTGVYSATILVNSKQYTYKLVKL
ncbi:MAG: alkaline phosphatase PhoX [Saprospiraceae bacterium]